MSRLWLVRHGPTHVKAMVGWTDVAADLSDTGAIGRLARGLPAGVPVVSSDLARAISTADAIQGERLRLPHETALREINFGSWEMRSFAQIDAESPELIRAYTETPGDVCPPGGESWNALCDRVGACLDRLAGRHPQLIVVAHFGPILSQVQRARGVSAQEVFAQSIAPLSVTCVDRATDQRPLAYSNRLF